MRIAVNTRLLLSGRLEGIGRFAHETLSRIVLNHPEHEFLFIFDRDWSEEFIYAPNIKAFKLFPPTRLPFLVDWFFQRSIPKFLKKQKADVFLSPDGWIPLNCEVPVINVIHDINYIHNSEWIKKTFRPHFRKRFPEYARKANVLVTVSDFSRKDIAATFDIPEKMILLACNGVSAIFHPIEPVIQENERKKLCGGKSFFLFIGSLNARKNIAGLIKAFDLFCTQSVEEIHLVIAGQKMFTDPFADEAFRMSPFAGRIHFAGRLNDEELVRTLGSALALTFVSHFEGFGIPILEAFACHTPVITSDTSSMPEIAGDAALLADSTDPHTIADAMLKISLNPDLCHKLIEKGKSRLPLYTWERAAESLWSAIEKATTTYNNH